MIHSILLPHLPIREHFIRRHVLRPAREPFIEPQVVPPCHGDEVPEPLVRELVRYDGADALLLVGACFYRID